MDNAEYDSLKQTAQELRKEMGMDKPLDRLELLRSEVTLLKGLKDFRDHDELRDPECEKLEARIKELQTELGLDRMDKLSRLKLSLKNLEYLKECRDEADAWGGKSAATG
jgi:hypothetical protein